MNSVPEEVLSVKYPETSTMTSVAPELLYTLTMPPDPTGTMTRLGTVWPAAQFRLEAVGRARPAGHTVKKLGAVVWVAVTLRIAAETPVGGTPPAFVTWISSVLPAPTVIPAFGNPLPERVSVMRAGVSATSWPAVPLGAAK